MPAALKTAALFAAVAFLLLLGLDAMLSLVFQSPPPAENRANFYFAHSVFHGAVLVLSWLGGTTGFLLIRSRLPSRLQSIAVALGYAFLTAFAGPGSFILAGLTGLAIWLFLCSMAFAVGAGLFSRPWRRSPST